MATAENKGYTPGNGPVLSDGHATIGGKRIPLTQVAAVNVGRRWVSSTLAILSIVIGLVMLVLGYYFWDGVLLTPMLGGAALVIVGAALLGLVRHRYLVQVVTKDGDMAEQRVHGRAEAQRIATSLQQQIER